MPAQRPDEEEDVKYENKPITHRKSFEAVIHYHDYDFAHEDKFGLRGYVYDVDSTGKTSMLMVSITQVLLGK